MPKLKFVCMCGEVEEVELGDFFVCSRCECENEVPDTIEVFNEWMNAVPEKAVATHHRVMVLGEDHVEFCERNNVPTEWLDYVVVATQQKYPEGKVFTEPEGCPCPQFTEEDMLL